MNYSDLEFGDEGRTIICPTIIVRKCNEAERIPKGMMKVGEFGKESNKRNNLFFFDIK